MKSNVVLGWRVGAVVVVYHPDLPRLTQLIHRLDKLVSHIVVVDNSEGGGYLGLPRCVQVIHPSENLGVAAALNLGVSALKDCDCTHVWSFDQDSLPEQGALEQFHQAWLTASSSSKIAALVPEIYDDRTQRSIPFLIEDSNGKVRRVNIDKTEIVTAAITSGMLFRIDAWNALGGALEPLFIDHVDTEWCYRLRAAGWRILAVPRARINHQLGEPGPKFVWMGPKVTIRSPLRTYFMLRNGGLLNRMSYVSPGWKSYQRIQMLKIAAVAVLHGPQRCEQIKAVFRAAVDVRRDYPWVR